MTPFDPDVPLPEPMTAEPADAEDQFPARRLLAHDADDAWLEDELDGWRPID